VIEISVEKSVVVCVIRVPGIERDFKFVCPTGDRALAAFLARELESCLVMHDGEDGPEEPEWEDVKSKPVKPSGKLPSREAIEQTLKKQGCDKAKLTITTNATVQAFADRLRDVGRMPANLNKESVLLLASEFYGISGVSLLGSHQSRDIVQVRHVVAYLCRHGVGMRTGDIAKFLGINPSYMSTCLTKLKEKFLTNTKLKNEVAGLLDLVKSLPGG